MRLAVTTTTPRDKKGRLLPRMSKENLAEMLSVSSEMSSARLLNMASKVAIRNPTLAYNLRMMCYLDQDTATGTLRREMKRIMAQ